MASDLVMPMHASRHCQITMQRLLNLNLLWWNISLRNVQLSSSRHHGLKTRSGMSECETGMVTHSNHAAEKQNGENIPSSFHS